MHLNSDEILVEFEDIPGIHGIKKIICTPLYLRTMPFLRYEVGDTAIPIEKQCDCGLPYPVIELKVGRISDNLISASGKVISGVTLAWYIVDAVEGVHQYQIIQNHLSDITVKLVSEQEYIKRNEESIKNLLYETMGSTEINIKFEYPDEIRSGKNGKFCPIISNVINKPNKQASIDEYITHENLITL
jgi:phenylacetate-CoA ligase